MNVWLPYVIGGSGTDVFTQTLADGLQKAGQEVIIQPIPHRWQYCPGRLRSLPVPADTHIVLTNSWNGFAFARPHLRLVVVEHHCILDQAYTPYRSMLQGFFHETFVRRFELNSFSKADAIVAVSHYTARSLNETLGVKATDVIYNGVDVEFFSPGPPKRKEGADRVFRLLFVGNLSSRKGADLLPGIMSRLGDRFELRFTSGLRTQRNLKELPNVYPLGRLSKDALKQAYIAADVLLVPSRLEGFGYVAAESMACGTPVIASRSSSLPELVEDGRNGFLCKPNDIDSFVRAIKSIAADKERLREFGVASRRRVETEFSVQRMTRHYLDLLQRVTSRRE